MYLIVFIFPATRANLWVPPMPGMRPSLSSGKPNLASSEQKTTSQSRDSSQPPPSATPLTPATMGFLALQKVSCSYLKISLLLKSLAVLFSNYLMFAPAQNAFLTLLKITITLTSFDDSNSLIFLTRFDLIYVDKALQSFWLSKYNMPILFSILASTFEKIDLVSRELTFF